jgi:signal transduction histidine kinase
MKERIREREERLRAFNRTLTHELRNRIGATMGAGQLLQMPEIPETERWVEVTGRIVAVTDDTPAHVVVEVRDNGLGVPLPQRERLFERFFRAGVETVTGVEGTGLGLSIVRETVEALGGRAWAEFPEELSVFAFSLPVRRASDPTPADGVAVIDEVSASS